MFSIIRKLVITAAVVVAASRSVAFAQSGSIVAVPFVTTIAGQAPGSTGTANTRCAATADIANSGGQHSGDGCLPTQAGLGGVFDVFPTPGGDILITENGAGGTLTLQDIRVIYNGSAYMTALLKAANPALANTALKPGLIYTLAGGLSAALSNKNQVFYCGNVTGNVQALDLNGDGCPAAQAYIRPRGMTLDAYGDIYFENNASLYNNLRVIYNGGPQLKALLALLFPTVTPQIGYVYRLGANVVAGYSHDGQLATNTTFFTARYVALDSVGNIYVSDGAPHSTKADTNTPANNIVVDVSAASVRKIDIKTGIVTTVAGENNCDTAGPYAIATYGCQYGAPVEGQPAVTSNAPGPTSSPYSVGTFDAPYTMVFDQYDNLFIADQQNGRVRVVYAGGTLPGIPNPIVGAAYTYVGGGTLTADGTAAKNIKFSSITSIGADSAGNLYVKDTAATNALWKIDRVTGIGNVIASTKTQTAGAVCSGGTTGPVSQDTLGDGCPAVQAGYGSSIGAYRFDAQGNFYIADATNNIVRKFSYNNVFPGTNTGSPVAQQLAFKATAPGTLSTESFTLEGQTTSEFSDAGGATCSLGGTLLLGQVCLVNVSFSPSRPGARLGSLQLNTVTGPAVVESLSGSGVAPDMAIDTGTQMTLGSGITPAGVATDLNGNVYVSDRANNQVLTGSSNGTTLKPLVTSGLKQPSQIAVDNLGNIYIADTGNNRILEVNQAGTSIASLGYNLSAPAGVAVDPFGNVFVADTGNNRIVTVTQNGNQTVAPLTGLTAPTQLAFDSTGNLYIVDSGNGRLALASGGTVSTFTLDAGVVPTGVAVDASGTVYVADSAGQQVLSYAPGALTGNLLLNGFGSLAGLAADADANLFLADSKATGAIELRRTTGSFQFPITNLNTPTTVNILVTNVGNAPLLFPTPPAVQTTGSPYITAAPAATNGCTVGSSTPVATACSFTATFNPPVIGPASATATFNSNAADNGAVTAQLSGTGYKLTATTTNVVVQSPTGGVFFAQTVVIAANLVPASVTVAPTGTFSVSIDGKTPTKQPVGNGSITVTVPNLVVGTHSVAVSYSGDTVYASSAGTLTITVNKAQTTTVVTATPLSNGGSLSLVIAANESSTTANCGGVGTITFFAGTQQLGQPQVPDSKGNTSITLPSLSFTNNNVTAVFSGSANCAASTSALVTGGGDFAIGTANPSLTIPQGGILSASFQVASLLGASGNVNFSCTGLPANSVCRFQPVVMMLSGTAQQTMSLQLYTNINPSAENHAPLDRTPVVLWVFAAPLGMLLLFRKRRGIVQCSGIAVLLIVVFSAFTGCGAGITKTDGFVTPTGTYPITVVFTGSNGLTATHSVPVSLTVITGN